MLEKINTKKGTRLLIEKNASNNQVEISLHLKSDKSCILHWGLCHNHNSLWHIPPDSSWPDGSRASGESALQSPFINVNGESRINIRFDNNKNFFLINFVLFYPDENCWDNNNGKNYLIKLPNIKKSFLPLSKIIKNEVNPENIFFEKEYNLNNYGEMIVAVTKKDDNYKVLILTNTIEPLILHWGVSLKYNHEWLLPHASIQPHGTVIYENSSAQTPFTQYEGLYRLSFEFNEEDAPSGIPFVLKTVNSGRWIKDSRNNFYIPVNDHFDKEGQVLSLELSSISSEIINGEMSHNSWTLMHRFNLAYNLLDAVKNDIDGLALIYVWLRFSAIRQLDWQRNYNTKPRELSHSIDRLTFKLADIFIDSDADKRELIRLILTTAGRGGEGQRIRDEILNIMHKHKVKEVTGHFMEEWHQKLHNNTTPDDIVICEAYLEFLKSDGNLDAFYKTLKAGGVTKKRLKSFERPIVTEPDFVPHLKEGLIYSFENYLKVLKSVHSATDLESSIIDVKRYLDQKFISDVDFISRSINNESISVVDIIHRIIDVRSNLNELLNNKNNEMVRALLLLDISLEEFLRVIIERNIHKHLKGEQLVELIGSVLMSLRLSHDTDELSDCFNQWEKIKSMPLFNQNWSLLAKSVIDRLGRLLGVFIDNYYETFQPKAELLGSAFNAESWTITLFSEEVVRGRPPFVLSMLLRHIDPILRNSANLGSWQVISMGQAIGQVQVIDTLISVQDKIFDKPMIIIADKVKGDEEIPENVTAVITPDVTDIVSHVAVRARNAHLLFATCYDNETINHIKSLKGQFINLRVDTSGDVIFKTKMAEQLSNISSRTKEKLKEIIPIKKDILDALPYTVPSTDFNEKIVGGKSNNLTFLKNKLPDWIHLPTSVAMPFGIFERVLNDDKNQEVAKQYYNLVNKINNKQSEILSDVRKLLLNINSIEEIESSLQNVMGSSGLPYPDNWDNAFRCIKQVWASKWNDRAYLSRQARGIPHDSLLMAVLIQQVVEPEYAFVIHTANPFTGDRDELYAEVVSGLGETLVGNYPGRALGFVSNKDRPEPFIMAYPSKSTGLYGKGLIFRSDSNGEDLAGYAGAGLYDSVMLEPTQEVTLNYTNERIIWDDDFRRILLTNIIKIGIEVEKVFKGSPQDIEGAYSKGNYYVVQTRPQVGL